MPCLQEMFMLDRTHYVTILHNVSSMVCWFMEIFQFVIETCTPITHQLCNFAEILLVFLKLKWAFSSLKQLAIGDTNSKYARNEYLSQVTSYVVSWSPLFGCSLDRSFLDLNCTELNPVIWINILLRLDNEHRLINPPLPLDMHCQNKFLCIIVLICHSPQQHGRFITSFTLI